MEPLAVWLGTFIGAVLKQCAPVLVAILSEAITRAGEKRAVVGKPNADLERLWLGSEGNPDPARNDDHILGKTASGQVAGPGREGRDD